MKRDAKTFASVSDDWLPLILKKYPILAEHPDLIRHIDPYYVPEDVDASDKVLDPWEIAIEIAAREVIPDYQNSPLRERPTGETLKKCS